MLLQNGYVLLEKTENLGRRQCNTCRLTFGCIRESLKCFLEYQMKGIDIGCQQKPATSALGEGHDEGW